MSGSPLEMSLKIEMSSLAIRYTKEEGLLIHCIAGEILTKDIKYRWPSSPDVRRTKNSCQWHAKNSSKFFPFVIRKAEKYTAILALNLFTSNLEVHLSLIRELK